MKYLLMSLLLVTSSVVLAQEPVSSSGDSSIDALISKVEGKPESTSLVNDFKVSDDFQKGANDLAEAYYNAMLTGDLIAAYGHMSKVYREAVSLQTYLRKNRLAPSAVHISKLQFKGQTCARVFCTVTGIANAQLGNISLPVKLRIFEEDGTWVVFDNPYIQMSFELPKAASVKYPCKF